MVDGKVGWDDREDICDRTGRFYRGDGESVGDGVDADGGVSQGDGGHEDDVGAENGEVNGSNGSDTDDGIGRGMEVV